jgi:hypothetical protein
MAIIRILLHWGNRKVARGQVKQVGWMGDDSHVVFGGNFPGEKLYTVVMPQPFLLSSEFWAKSSHIFTHSLIKCHSSMGN